MFIGSFLRCFLSVFLALSYKLLCIPIEYKWFFFAFEPIEYEYFLNRSIGSVVGTLTGTFNTLGLSGTGSNGNEGVLHNT